MCDIAVADHIVSTLMGNPERESEYDFVRSKADLYSELCEWKDKSTTDVGMLYAAIGDPRKIKGAYLSADIIAGNQMEYRNIRWSCRLLVLNNRAWV